MYALATTRRRASPSQRSTENIVNQRIDYDRLSATYDDGRAFPEAWLQEWREATAPYLGDVTGPILDLGSGTGIWALLLAKWFGVEVVGVEPSSGMRAEAVYKR